MDGEMFEETDFHKEETTEFLNHPLYSHCLEQMLVV